MKERRRVGRRDRIPEKPKNLKLSLKKLMKYLRPYTLFIVFALLLASCSSILSIIGPDKLSDLTDEISTGLSINRDNLNIFIGSIQNDIQNNIVLSKDKLNTLSEEEKVKYQEFISKINDSNKEEIFNLISSLSDNTKKLFFNNSIIDNIEFSSEDKLVLFNAVYKLNNNDVETAYKDFELLNEDIYNLLKPSMNISKIKNIAKILVVMYLLSALFNYTQNYLMLLTSNRFAKSLRTKIINKINKLALKYFDDHSFGDILSRVTNDVDTINMSLHNSLGTLVSSLSLFIGSIIMMFKTNYIMAITGMLSSLIGFAFMSKIIKRSQKYFIKRQVELGKLNGHIEEIYSSHNVVKVYNGSREAREKFEEYNDSVYNCNKMSQFLSGLMQPMMGFIGNFGYVCVCIVGAILVINNKISYGVIVAFIMYVRLFTGPLSQIAQSLTNLQSATAASERVFEFIESPEMSSEEGLTKKLDKNTVKGSIEFEHVKFGYNDDKIIIKDFNCKVKPGQKIAIVGPTGAGKTTIVNLLMKFYEINSGDIKIDGVSINELTRENIHELFIMVLQDTWLFNGTIRENIKFNKNRVKDSKVWEALKVVGIDHFVKTLPNGLDYKIEDNESISAGQKQLLTIARGMIENAPFLILDEATSSVDTRTEELVQTAMDKLTEKRTAFIIAHRLSTIKNADLILVMKDGNIVEQGSHEELLKQNGFYAELYNSQFQN